MAETKVWIKKSGIFESAHVSLKAFDLIYEPAGWVLDPDQQADVFRCLPEYFLQDIVDNFKFITRNMPQIITTTQCEELVNVYACAGVAVHELCCLLVR